MNEITGAVKWPYDPIIHFPKGDVEDWSHLGSGVLRGRRVHRDGCVQGRSESVRPWRRRRISFRHYVELALK